MVKGIEETKQEFIDIYEHCYVNEYEADCVSEDDYDDCEWLAYTLAKMMKIDSISMRDLYLKVRGDRR